MTAAARVGLRAVVTDDRPFLREVYASTRADELAFVPWTDEQKQMFTDQQFDAQDAYYRQHYEGAAYDVVLVDGEPAGRLYVARWDDEIRIMDIALLPAFRGRGIGRRLLEPLLREGAEAGKSVSVHVEQSNRAMSLYRRLGFVEIGEHGVYRLMRWTPS